MCARTDPGTRGFKINRLEERVRVARRLILFRERRVEWSGRETLTHPKSIPQDIEKEQELRTMSQFLDQAR